MEKDDVKPEVIVIGGSAGSLDAILRIIEALPATLRIPVIIIVHRKNSYESILVDLIMAKTKLSVKEVEDKDIIVPGTIYIAPADYHLLVEDDDVFSLDSSEKVHYSRPSIDITLESVADVYGSAVIAVLLSGANADGASGLEAVYNAGGLTIVQDPATANIDYMPRNAINAQVASLILKPDEIGDLIVSKLG